MKWIQRIISVSVLYITTLLYLVVRIQHSRTISDESFPVAACIQPLSEFAKPVQTASGVKDPEIHVFERKQFGPGINGSGVAIEEFEVAPEDIPQFTDDYSKDDFNGYLSDVISVHRIVADYRPEMCKSLKYPDDLPQVGIVIPFKDEHLSVLLRTVYSILYNTPEHLLREIVLVDDGSVNSELKSILNIHLANLPKVRTLRMRKSVGLMMARQAGINSIDAEYFICMDCHMEVLAGWLEPLLSRLLEEPKALLCSNIGSIDRHTFKLHHAELWQIRQIFPFLLFNLDTTSTKYKRSFVDSRASDTDPFPFGIIQGMMIVMRKSWFFQLGGFDPGMKIWGSEQMELSIKIDIGDVSHRIRIRQENHCKPFNFYLDKVREFADFEFTEIRNKGAVKNLGTDMCLDPLPSKRGPIQYICHGDEIQFFELTQSGKLRFLEHCMLPRGNNSVALRFCSREVLDESEAEWDFTENKQIKHVKSGRCLTANGDKKSVELNICLDADKHQMWSWYVMK